MDVCSHIKNRRGVTNGALLVLIGGTLMIGIAVGLVTLMVNSKDARDARNQERGPKTVNLETEEPSVESTPATTGNATASGSQTPVPSQPERTGTQGPQQQSRTPVAVPLEIEPKVLEFGIVGPNEDLTAEIMLRNPTDTDMTILKLAPSCKCTVVDMAGTVIPANSTVPLTIKMNSENRMGPKRSQVKIMLQEYPGGVMSAHISAMVQLPVYSVPAAVTATDVQEGVITVQSMDKRPFRILTVNNARPPFVEFDPTVDPVTNTYRLRWDTSVLDPETCLLPDGSKPRPWLIICTDHPDCRVFDVQIRHECTKPSLPTDGRKWYLATRRGPLGALKPGDSTILEVEMKWLPNIDPYEDLYAITTSSGAIEAELVDYRPLQKSQKVKVRVTLTDRHAGGEIWETLYLHSEYFNAELPVFGFAIVDEQG